MIVFAADEEKLLFLLICVIFKTDLSQTVQNTLEKFFVSATSKSVIETGKPKSTKLVTPCSLMPQGTIP